MDKKVSVQLNGTRKVVGTLRGFDVCMNNHDIEKDYTNHNRCF